MPSTLRKPILLPAKPVSGPDRSAQARFGEALAHRRQLQMTARPACGPRPGRLRVPRARTGRGWLMPSWPTRRTTRCTRPGAGSARPTTQAWTPRC